MKATNEDFISKVERRRLPQPTEEDMKSPLFRGIWNAINGWTVHVPKTGQPYISANAQHAMHILNMVREEVKRSVPHQVEEGSDNAEECLPEW